MNLREAVLFLWKQAEANESVAGKMSKIQPSYDTNRQILGKLFPLDTPNTVIIDSSELCNFRCSYCFRSDDNKENWSYAANQGIMDWDVFERTFEQIKMFPHDVRQISVSHHGEPLINQRLPLMVRYMREHGYSGRISMHTNGSMINRDNAKEIGECGFSRIIVSIQGVDPSYYLKTCSYKIDWEEFTSSLSLLYQAKEKVGNGTEIFVKIADVALSGRTEDDFYNIFNKISDRMFVEKVVPIWKDIDNDINKNMTEGNEVISKFGNKFPRQKCCRIAFDTVVVLPNGDIYPCTQLLGPQKMGNIFDTSLVEYWNSEDRKQLLRDILTLETPHMCDNCYILQNSIYTKEDMIDDYREEILGRMG